MASGGIQQHTRDFSESYKPTLLSLLSNTLVLRQILPHLSVSARLSIAASSQTFRELLHHAPGVFRHIDLSNVKSAQFQIEAIDHGGEVWRNVQVDENLSEDDFYTGPLRGIFYNLRRNDIMQNVQTLVLDGLSVTAELVHDILVDPKFHIRILSIREVRSMNERKLMQSLRFACRAGRPDGQARLKGLYVFGKKDTPALPATAATATTTKMTAGSTSSSTGVHISINWNHKSTHALKEAISGEGDDWYDKKGRIISRPIEDGWAETLLDCRESMHFDAVLCTGPGHQNSPAYGKIPCCGPTSGDRQWNVATFALGGCATCGSAPEGLTVHGSAPASELPLLAPLPLHSSHIKVAACPQRAASPEAGKPGFVPRCWDCIRERYCFSCDQWWCEACYQVPSREDSLSAQHVHIVDDTSGLADHEAAAVETPKVKNPKIKQECWECKRNCLDCIARTQRHCMACGGGYCIVHYDGSTMTLCDWCSSRGHRVRRVFKRKP